MIQARAAVFIAHKDLRLLLRDRGGLFVTFVFPVVYAVFLGVIFGSRADGTNPLPVAVVDQDGSAASIRMIDQLRGAPALALYALSKDEAEAALREGLIDAMIVVPSDFGQTEGGTDTLSVQLMFKAATADDPVARSRVLGAIAQTAAGETAQSQSTWTQPFTTNRSKRSLPVAVGGRFDLGSISQPRNQFELAFPLGLAWGVLGCTATFGLSFVAERTRGTLVRLRLAPLRRTHVVVGKTAACVVTTFALGVIMMLLAVGGFDVRPRSYVLLAAALACTSVAFAGIMMLLAGVGKTERSAGGLTWTVLLSMAMIGGGMVPHFLMPRWMQYAADVSPVRWAILALEGAVWRDFSAGEMALPCAVLLAIGIVFSLVGAAVLRWT